MFGEKLLFSIILREKIARAKEVKPLRILGKLKVVASDGLGVSLLFRASFLIMMHITAHKSKYVKVRVSFSSEYLELARPGFLM